MIDQERAAPAGVTPGEWIMSGVYVRARAIAIAQVYFADGDAATRRANGQLLAAAPDLYEACAFVMAHLDRLEGKLQPADPLRRIRQQCQAALAKARGETTEVQS